MAHCCAEGLYGVLHDTVNKCVGPTVISNNHGHLFDNSAINANSLIAFDLSVIQQVLLALGALQS